MFEDTNEGKTKSYEDYIGRCVRLYKDICDHEAMIQEVLRKKLSRCKFLNTRNDFYNKLLAIIGGYHELPNPLYDSVWADFQQNDRVLVFACVNLKYYTYQAIEEGLPGFKAPSSRATYEFRRKAPDSTVEELYKIIWDSIEKAPLLTESIEEDKECQASQ